jgi:serine-type D-Ala-D-Ala carboxypeptidase
VSPGSPELPGVAAVLEAARAEGVAPALSACVLAGGRTVHASLHGQAAPGDLFALRQAQGKRPLGPDDLFDVASLTKVLATAGVAVRLAAEGRLELDAPAARWMPRFAAAGKGAVTVRQLLAHSSGLPAWRPYFEEAPREPAAGRRAVVEAACAEPLEAAPGTRALYSDVGFIALGAVLEAVGGAPLPAQAEAALFRPLGLSSTFFLDQADPAARARAAGRTFVATGESRARGTTCQGAVHDDNAWAMGGVAGHAGLFSTAAEVAALGQAWLDALSGRPSVVPAAEAAGFARRDPTPGSDRALGWDRPGGPAPAIGGRLGRGPRGAIGHLGYTGCSLWLDRDAGLVCALLTNHTHPSGQARRERIGAVRRRFHDAVATAMGI